MPTKISKMSIKFENTNIQKIKSQTLTRITKERQSLYKPNRKVDLSKAFFVGSVEAENPIGTFLLDFIGVNFDDFNHFIRFFTDWGLSGLVAHAPGLGNLDCSVTAYVNNKDYFQIMKSLWNSLKSKLHKIQQDYKEAFKVCLCPEGPEWSKDLSPLQRTAVQNYLDIPLTIRPLEMLGDPTFSNFLTKYSRNLNVRFEVFPDDYYKEKYVAYWKNQEQKKLPVSSPKDLAEQYKTITFKTETIYSSYDIAAICYVEFMLMLLTRPKLKECGRCEQYFIPSRPDVKYCNRVYSIVDDNQYICSKTGASHKRAMKLKKPQNYRDKVSATYQKVYNRMFSRKKLQGKKRLSQTQFEQWECEAMLMKQQMYEKIITTDEFENWVKNWTPIS